MAEETSAEGGAAAEELSLVDNIIQNGRIARDESQVEYARDLVAEFATQTLDEGMTADAAITADDGPRQHVGEREHVRGGPHVLRVADGGRVDEDAGLEIDR